MGYSQYFEIRVQTAVEEGMDLVESLLPLEVSERFFFPLKKS